jgi:TolA-binding protein
VTGVQTCALPIFREEEANASQAASRVLSGLFSPPPALQPGASANFAPPSLAATSAWPAESAQTFAPRSATSTQRPAPPAAPPQRTVAIAPASADAQKLRHEIRRLELLVKKLQAELEAQKQYCAALEADFKSMQESE